MIEINGTFFIQLLNFLVLVLFLNKFLFKPVLENVAKREKRIKSFTDEAEDMTAKADKAIEEYEAKFAETKKESADILHQHRQQSGVEQQKIISAARSEFTKQIDGATADIQKYADAASKELQQEAESIADVMTGKILGRSS